MAERDSAVRPRLGIEGGELRGYEKYGGVEIANETVFHGRSGGNNEAEGMGRLDGVRPGKEWSPAGVRRWSA